MKIKQFFKKYWLIILIWIIGLFLRCYNQTDLLGFYYDQGRDAKMAQDIISGYNFPAIGPTTGIAGLFLGPFWFYLIVPGYFLGQGNPAIAAYFISFLESLTIPLIYYFVKKYWNPKTAYVASILWSLSHYLIRSSRWFSNPSSLPTFVLIAMILLIKIVKDKHYKLLPYLALIIGLSLQLEAASAIFFIPIILVFGLINFSTILKIKLNIWLKSIIYFCSLLLPQAVFEIKNNFLISRNLIGFLTGKINSDSGKSWGIPDLSFLIKRTTVYYQAFFSKLDTNITNYSIIFLVVFLIGILYLLLKYRNNIFIKLQLLWLLIPLLLLLFFIGNYGTLYDYYLTGFYPAFIILFAIVITLPKNKILFILVIFSTVLYFYQGNIIQIKNYLTAKPDGPLHISLGNELAAVKYICQKNSQQLGNIDYYLPPVIAHSYEYLISWQQKYGHCNQFDQNHNQIVYLILEVDPPHPERLSNWLDKYKQDQIIDEQDLGGITVKQLLRKN